MSKVPKGSNSRKAKLIGSYRLSNDERIFKILRYKDVKNNTEHFWLYKGDCLCHARDHKKIKNKKTFESYTFVQNRIIYDENENRIGQVIADHPDSLTPLEITFNRKKYKLYELGTTKNTTTTLKLSWSIYN